MEIFRQQFLLDSVKNIKQCGKLSFRTLKNLTIRKDAKFSEHFIQLKGSAQTFGFTVAGQIAHELENLLSAGQAASDESFQKVFSEGITFLITALERKTRNFPRQFIEKIHSIIPSGSQPQNISNISLPENSAQNCRMSFANGKSSD